MEAKHTPGNWITKEGQIYSEETGKTIAIIPYFDEDDETQKADAKLIASAPDLLRSLEFAVKFIDNCPHLDEDSKPAGLNK